nr:6-methylsalicylic acid synthase [Ipomoea batatas]GME06600.1 6-methylsalicylic acid synthase [Ipomoea batatas]
MDSSSDLHGKEPPLLPPPIWVADSIFGSENSSSGLSTPFGSVGSTRTETESDDDEGEDFLAELTRQMAGYTLQDEDDEPNALVEDHEQSPKFKEELANSSANSDSANHAMRPIEVYTMKDQSSLRKQSNPTPRGRRVAKTESIHQRVEHAAEAEHMPKKGRRRGNGHGGGRAHTLRSGSGMQAVFLGGSGYVTGASSSGTGVFIPRGCNYHSQTEPKMKTGTLKFFTNL